MAVHPKPAMQRPCIHQQMSTQQQGFTLFELVLVIVLLGIAGVGISQLMPRLAELYWQQAQQEQLLQQSRFLLERLSREIRAAVPYSLRHHHSNQMECLEFVRYQASGRYRELPKLPDTANQLRLLSLDPALAPALQVSAGQWLLIQPRSAVDIYQNSSQKVALAAAPTVNDADGETATITVQLAQPHGFAVESPAQRFYLLQDAVSFCIEGQQLRRYQGYGLQAQQPLPGAGLDRAQGQLLAEQLQTQMATEPVFHLVTAGFHSQSFVRIFLQLANPAEPDVVMVFNHLVQVDNVP